MIITKKEGLKMLYHLARTDEEMDFLHEGQKRMKNDPEYDVVYEYVLTYKCPHEFLGFVWNDAIFMREERYKELWQ